LFACNLDPEAAAKAYREKVVGPYRGKLPDSVVASMEEQLSGACTVEIAAFDEFTNLLTNLDTLNQFDHVIFDTAPTGHTLLLLDAAQAYHKELARSTGEVPESVKQLLPRLRNPKETEIVIVTLPEATPVLEAERLQEDLKRANIHPSWWVINQSFYATETKDPILQGKAQTEIDWIQKVSEELAEKAALIPWLAVEKVDIQTLIQMMK
jgi:arsenite-transporting ATPase